MLEYTECVFVVVIQTAPSSLWLGYDFLFYLQIEDAINLQLVTATMS